jgi:RES domain-containing protein
MLGGDDLQAALQKISPSSVDKSFYRIVRRRYRDQPLSIKGSLRTGGRYNLPQYFIVNGQQRNCIDGFGSLYLSRTVEIAEVEVGIKKVFSQSVFEVRCRCDKVLDLTNQNNLSILGTNDQEITGQWGRMNDRGEGSPTQQLALCVKQSERFTTIKFPSAKKTRSIDYNLVVLINILDSSKQFSSENVYLEAKEIHVSTTHKLVSWGFNIFSRVFN